MAKIFKSLRVGIVVAFVIPFTTNCGNDAPNPHSRQAVSASAPGIASLFEAECLNRRSIDWAMSKYESERAACLGESNCQGNVTGVEWSVRANNSPLQFKASYFFDEVKRPSNAEASCEILVPKELGGEVAAAARNLASKHRLAGPFRSGERGFSIPTLKEYWTDNQGQPKIGVFYYPADVGSSDPIEKGHAAYPWTLMQWSESVPY